MIHAIIFIIGVVLPVCYSLYWFISTINEQNKFRDGLYNINRVKHKKTPMFVPFEKTEADYFEDELNKDIENTEPIYHNIN